MACQENIKSHFPEFFVHMTFYCWCNFISLFWRVLFPPRVKPPLSTANTNLPPQNLRHMFNNSSLFHVGYFTLTPHFRGRLLRKHAGPITSPESAWERPSSIYPCWLAREWRARRPSTLHIPVKTTAPDVHLNQDWKGSCASRSEMSKLRRWFIFDLDYGGVADRGQRVMQIFNDTC